VGLKVDLVNACLGFSPGAGFLVPVVLGDSTALSHSKRRVHDEAARCVLNRDLMVRLRLSGACEVGFRRNSC
jgi:hypothetical protein